MVRQKTGTVASLAFLSMLLISACSSDSPDLEQQPGQDPALQICQDPRPEICTREYNPVCAVLEDDSRRTYATGCTACSDATVKSWLPGECP